jgi:glutaredoxin
VFIIYGALESKACYRAEFCLRTLGCNYRVYYIGLHFTAAQIERLIPGVKTIPQIFYGTKYIGGLKELHEFLQKSESIANGEISRLTRLENMFNGITKNGQDHSGVHKEE